VPRDEVEAAYFTLLRAREELAALRRYDEYLHAEARAAALRQPRARRSPTHRRPRLRRALRTPTGRSTEALDGAARP
jgi:hypothetical protein